MSGHNTHGRGRGLRGEEEVEVDNMIPILLNQRETSRRICKIINTTLDLLNKLLIMKQLHLI
jgi:hypothetical protein